MNQYNDPRRSMQDATERDGASLSPAALLAVDYDDGNPATIQPVGHPHPAAGPGCPAVDTPATPLAGIARDAAVDYDDGDPATIIC